MISSYVLKLFVWAQPGRLANADYTLDVTPTIQNYLSEELAMPYSLEKLGKYLNLMSTSIYRFLDFNYAENYFIKIALTYCQCHLYPTTKTRVGLHVVPVYCVKKIFFQLNCQFFCAKVGQMYQSINQVFVYLRKETLLTQTQKGCT